MNKFEVGQLLKQGTTKYPEGTKFDIQRDGAVLFIFFNEPTVQEIEFIKNGKAKLGIWEKDNIIFFLSKFGDLSWMDAPYTVHLSPIHLELEYPQEGLGYALHIILVDAKTGIIKAMRLIGLSTRLSTTLYKYIKKQTESTFNQSYYDIILSRTYQNYTTNDMVKYGVVG